MLLLFLLLEVLGCSGVARCGFEGRKGEEIFFVLSLGLYDWGLFRFGVFFFFSLRLAGGSIWEAKLKFFITGIHFFAVSA